MKNLVTNGSRPLPPPSVAYSRPGAPGCERCRIRARNACRVADGGAGGHQGRQLGHKTAQAGGGLFTAIAAVILEARATHDHCRSGLIDLSNSTR